MNKVNLKKEPTVIAKGMENFISFQIEELAFKDSLQFLNSSLSNLGDKAHKSEGKLTLEQVFLNLDKYIQENWWHLPNHKKAFSMLTRKGVYPYSYMDSFGQLFTHIYNTLFHFLI